MKNPRRAARDTRYVTATVVVTQRHLSILYSCMGYLRLGIADFYFFCLMSVDREQFRRFYM